jgi:fermentation-respiration switch protein FrsA (DUF1100 family)
MTERYLRAALMTEPKIAANTPGTSVEGYWVDSSSFFFLAERMESALGRIMAIPSIANADANKVEELMSHEELAALLSTQSDTPVTLEALSWAELDMPDRYTLSVSVAGQGYLIDLIRRAVIRTERCDPAPALYSPDGHHACFVEGYDLWLRDRKTGAVRAWTMNGAAHNCYGQQSETGLGAISYRQRPSPVGLWSPDSKWFLTHRIDERSLPEMPLVQHAPPGGGRPVLHRYKYPLPGDPLPVATYLAIHVESGRMVCFDDFPVEVAGFSPFLFRRVWFSGPDTAWMLRVDRYCKHAELIRLDLAQGDGKIVLSERVESGYLDLHPLWVGTPNVRTLPESSEIIWFSERDGWGHLYLYDIATGVMKNQITRGEWLVRDLVHVDEANRKVLFLANGVDPDLDPARKTLCSVNFDGSGFEVVLSHAGDIYLPPTEPCGLEQDRPYRPSGASAGVSADGRFGVVRYGSVSHGNRTEIVDLSTRQGFTIASVSPLAGEPATRPFAARAADEKTRLHGVMFFPPDFDANEQYPLVDYIYPGPQVAHQPQSYRALNSAPALALAELGFVVIMLDTRAMPIGSRAFHQQGYGTPLEPQLADHAAVVRQLCAQHRFIDPDRVGMIGQSGGGSATARALFDYAGIFKVAVAACGNHDSNRFAALWSDKYRGPGDPQLWAKDANNAVAHKLQGKLLLISGEMDEAVHVSQTLSLVDSLIHANKDFDLLIVPNEGHSVLMTNGYALRRAWDYLVRHLLGKSPPRDFVIAFDPHELYRFAKRCAREVRNP